MKRFLLPNAGSNPGTITWTVVMKKGFSLLFCTIFSLTGAKVLAGQTFAATDALKVLNSTAPIGAPWSLQVWEPRANNLAEVQRKATQVKLYAEQLEAIDELASAKVPESAEVLIKYLDYSVPDFLRYSTDFHQKLSQNEKVESLADTRSHWPALNALLDTPGSARVLKDFSLDVRNDIGLRVGAFMAMSYYQNNAEDLLAVANKLEDEFGKSNAACKQFIQDVLNHKHSFEGTEIYL